MTLQKSMVRVGFAKKHRHKVFFKTNIHNQYLSYVSNSQGQSYNKNSYPALTKCKFTLFYKLEDKLLIKQVFTRIKFAFTYFTQQNTYKYKSTLNYSFIVTYKSQPELSMHKLHFALAYLTTLFEKNIEQFIRIPPRKPFYFIPIS